MSKFTEAMLYHDPAWIPGLFPGGFDPGRRQWLFQILTGPLLSHFGFLAVSIAGRLLSFGLYACAFASLAKSLRIHPALMVLVVAALDYAPSVVAGEWLFWGFESKTISYPLIFLSLSCAIRSNVNLKLVALLTGLAVSFHPLAGLYGAFAIAGVLIWQRRPASLRQTGQALGIFLVSGLFAFRPIAIHLLGRGDARSAPTGPPSSYVYVYLRAPHHLDPSSWDPAWWNVFFAYILCAVLIYGLLRWRMREKFLDSLAIFCTTALLPFLFGLLIAPYDTRGSLLQFYLFRFGDVVLPFTVYVLAAILFQRALVERIGKVINYSLWLLLALTLALKLPEFRIQISELETFPGPAQGISAGYLEVARWVTENTERGALIVTPPVGFETFPWLTRRRIAGTFKQTSLSGGLQAWYEGMTALGNLKDPWESRGFNLLGKLNASYRQNQTARVEELLAKFNSRYFLTFADHILSLPVAFANREYALYTLPKGEVQ